MPTENDFEEAIEVVERYISVLGDDILDQHSGDFILEENEKEVGFHSFIVKEASYDCIYTVSGREDNNIFVVRYSHDLLSAMESFIETERGKEIFELSDFDALEPQEAARKVVNRVSEKDIERLRFKLHEQISNTATISNITETNEVPIQGFTVIRHVFPLEESFGLPEFYDSLTAVTTTGEKGARYLNNSFAIEVPADDQGEEELSLSFDPEDVFS